jgi:hypothetical protein
MGDTDELRTGGWEADSYTLQRPQSSLGLHLKSFTNLVTS